LVWQENKWQDKCDKSAGKREEVAKKCLGRNGLQKIACSRIDRIKSEKNDGGPITVNGARWFKCNTIRVTIRGSDEEFIDRADILAELKRVTGTSLCWCHVSVLHSLFSGYLECRKTEGFRVHRFDPMNPRQILIAEIGRAHV
jgi:hypothetical protein